jgi:mxaA protein
VGVWFERRAIRIEKDTQGRRWLAVDYQLMNSPQALTTITLPAWKLKPREASSNELRIAEWPMTVAPLTPERAVARPGLGSLRPDRVAPPIVLAPIQRGLGVGLAGLLLTVLAWGSWWAWRNWRASTAQPFARALREMRDVDDASPDAWRALHRAFDATAGRVMRAESLPSLFQQSPHLQPMRQGIEDFFNQSAARFFEGKEPERAVAVHALCRELRRIEKRHER